MSIHPTFTVGADATLAAMAGLAMDRASKLQRRIDLANEHDLQETAFMYSEALRVGAGQQLDYINGLKSVSNTEVNRLAPGAYQAWSKAIRNIDKPGI